MPVFPGGGGGSLAPAGIPSYNVFTSPTGSDSAAGTQGAPVRTAYRATQIAIAEGGANINLADNIQAGGPVANQGLWLRNDGIAVPGFLNMNGARLRFLGNGKQSGQFVFERPGAARFVGGSTVSAVLPAIWVVGEEVPMDFAYLKVFTPELQGLPAPIRIGWDYVRKTDFNLEQISVTNATRSGGETVLTIDLTTASAWTAFSASRDANDVVRLNLLRPSTVAMSPWTPGTKIRVTTSDSDFPSIDATVTSQSDVLNLNGETSIYVEYVQAGATIATQPLVATVKSHGLQAGDFLLLSSTSSEFPSCFQMHVTGANVTTVTVFDPYGYSPRSASASANDIGFIVKQLRGRQVASGITFDHCSAFGYASTLDNFTTGPTLDMGGTSANDTRLYSCYFTGGLNWQWQDEPNNYDPLRTQVAILADPGAGTISGASFQAYDCQSQSGHVVWNPHQTEAHVYSDQWLQDSGGNSLPTFVLGDGSTFASVRLDRTRNDDAAQAVITIGSGYDVSKVQIGDVFTASATPVVSASPIQGPTNMRSANWNAAAVITESPWFLGWKMLWPGGLAMQHVGSNRALGPVQARYANVFPVYGSWVGGGGQPAGFPTGITVTNDGEGPGGETNAVKIVADNTFVSGEVVVGLSSATGAWSVGDYVAVGCWIRSSAATADVGLQMTNVSGGVTFSGLELDSSQFVRASRHILKDGWQWCIKTANVASVGNGHYNLKFVLPTGAGTYLFYGMSVVRAPITAGLSDLAEWAGTFKHQPVYLAPGMSGTMEDTKLIAHGGIGVSSTLAKTVGVGSGQLTLTGSGTTYVPIYAADGTTIQGWVAQLQATVNP